MECRLCLDFVPVESSVAIYENSKLLDLQEHILACCRLRVENHDEFPHVICSPCESNLISFLRFKMVCAQSDQKARQRPNQRTDMKVEEVLLDDIDVDFSSKRKIETSTSNLGDISKAAACKDRRSLNVDTQETVSNPCINVAKDSCEGKESFKCEICLKYFTKKEDLKIHMKSHREKPFKCEICSKCYVRKDSLNIHMKVHTGEKPFKCEICSKCFIQKYVLTTHMKYHTGDKPFKCNTCFKCFAISSDLNRHMLYHEGKKPFECELCSKCFVEKANLKRHMRFHAGEKPFKCELCSKCFVEKANLKTHMQYHSGERPYKCEICSKGFVFNQELTVHMRYHSGIKPFKCDVCPKRFTIKASLKKHLQRSHNSKKVTITVKTEMSH